MIRFPLTIISSSDPPCDRPQGGFGASHLRIAGRARGPLMRSGRDGGKDTSPREAEQGAGQPGTKKKNCISHKNNIFDLFSLLSYGV